MVEQSNETPAAPRSGERVRTKLLRIAAKARAEAELKFTTMYHLMNEEMLRECFSELKGGKAAGVDKMTKREYATKLEANIADLLNRLHQMSYRPQPVLRKYIPKPGTNKQRPLGIPTLEDKLVQKAMGRILEAIYEQEFIDDSYGFRPKRSCHDALRALTRAVEQEGTNFVVEADIKGFFDNVLQTKMMEFLERRIADKRVLRMIVRFLKAGVMEDGEWRASEKGTPQGGSISPMLANIYLHYALDEWFEKDYQKRSKGKARLIRYADDFVVCFQNKEDAARFLVELRERLEENGLEIEPTKTKMVEFGRYAAGNARARGEKPGTFDFLGFTHYCGRTRDGRRFRMKRETSSKKYRTKLAGMKEWIKQKRNQPMKEWMPKVAEKLRGHYQYYGVTDNYRRIDRFREDVKRLLYKWLNRRSQRRSFNWEEYKRLLERYPLPKPRIEVNLYAKSCEGLFGEPCA